MAYKRSSIPNFKTVTAPLRQVFPKVVEAVRQFADDERKDFIARIKLQAFPSFDTTPLSKAWAEEKARLHLDGRTMLAMHTMVDHIQIFVESESSTFTTVAIGFDEAEKAVDVRTKEKTKFALSLVALVQEKGSAKANIPPRPMWEPQQKVIEKHAVDLRKRITENLLRGLL